MSTIHLVTGAGPVGSTIARQLADAGQHVRLLTRSGSGPDHPLIERRRTDVSDPARLDAAIADATVSAVYHCIHGSRYDAAVWRRELPAAEQTILAAADRAGAVVVFPESLYAYGRVDGPITEDHPRTATTGKLGVRADLLRARAASPAPTVSVVASDFFGPEVRGAHAGERMIPTVLAGRTMRVVGSPDQPHSWTYVPDLAAAMIRAAAEPRLWNRVLHAPTDAPRTQRELIAAVAAAGGVPMPRVGTLPVGLLSAIGLVHRGTRELAETGYMFTGPFVMSSAASQDLLGLAPTPFEDAVAASVAWWRDDRDAAAQ